MSIVADVYEYVVGVDTHARKHVFAVVNPVTGGVVAGASFPADDRGLGRAVAWIERRAPGRRLVVIEGIGSYGARLEAVVAAAGSDTVEPSVIPAVVRRGQGKTDELDAVRIARSVVGVPVDRLRRPRTDAGVRDALAVLDTARDRLNGERTRAINALTALLRVHGLGVDVRGKLTGGQIRLIARWRPRRESLVAATARQEAVSLARRIVTLDDELADNRTRIAALVPATPAGELLGWTGIGPVSAAAFLIAWGHAGRFRSEAAFASLAGVAPIPVSSGNTSRYRLNRGGDRRLNRAFDVAAKNRMRFDPETRAYVARRTAEGRSYRDIKRVLKRHLARSVFRALERAGRSDPPVTGPSDSPIGAIPVEGGWSQGRPEGPSRRDTERSGVALTPPTLDGQSNAGESDTHHRPDPA